jgi:pimeloyl-ACP methyl ester carboxylesterase
VGQRPPDEQQQPIIFRTYRGKDLGEAQQRAWAEQPEAFLAGYFSSGQQWDEAKRTLTVRYERRVPAEQPARKPEPPDDGPVRTPVRGGASDLGGPRDHGSAQVSLGQPADAPPSDVRPQVHWVQTRPLARWRIVVTLVIIALLGAGAVAAANLDLFDQRAQTIIAPGTDTGPVPRSEPATCRGVRLGTAMLRCGDLIVPEDRARPDGSRIRLHYAVYPAEGGARQPDPVVYLDGGPGGSPLTDGFPIEPFVQQRDLVVLDQRGTGHSRPTLDCPELEAVALDAVEAAQALAIRDCRDRLVEEGVDRTRYTSAQSAADVEDLRTALGYPAWNLYGISYGTRLALTVMRDHPAGVRSAILDSVYPPNVDGYGEQPVNAERAFELLFAGCARQPTCAAAYPSLRRDFADTVERLDRDQPRVSVAPSGEDATEVALDGDVLIDFVFQNLYSTRAIPRLPQAIAAVADGDYTALTAHLADEDPPRGLLGQSDSKSEGMELSVQCAEELPFPADRLPGTETRVGRAFGIQAMQRRCATWDVPAAPQVERAAVTSEIPTLLLAGEFDPITPPMWAELAASTLSRGHQLIFPGVGHGVLGSSACADGLVSAFLLAPVSEPDGRCMTNLRAITFEVPEPAP